MLLDARWIRVDSGIGQYAYWLARTLPSVADDLDIEVVLPDRDDPLVCELRDRAELRSWTVPGRPGSPASLLRTAALAVRRGPAVYHSPDWMAFPGLSPSVRCVVTLHDLIPLVAPQQVPRSRKGRHPWLYRAALRLVATSASAVITDSHVWAREIVQRLGVEPARLRVVPLGVQVPHAPPTADAIRAARARLGLGEAPFLLTVGRSEPYKGLRDLLRAFARARREEKLVVVGTIDPRYSDLRDEARRLEISHALIRTGSVDPALLESLYAGASAFVTLSRLEGFGLPPLEAMARGVPAVVARNPVFQEVLGDAAHYVDPECPSEVAHGLRRVLDDQALRRRLVEAGYARARFHRWEECARETAATYRCVAMSQTLPTAPAPGGG